MVAERQIEHVSTTDIMYLDWDVLTRVDLPESKSQVALPYRAPRGKNARKNASRQQRGRAAGIPTLPKRLHRTDATRNQRKALWNARIQALRNVLEGYFVAHGWSIAEAIEFVERWVKDKLKMAQKVADSMGYSYLEMSWKV